MTTKDEFLSHIASKLGRSRIYSVKQPKWNRNPWDHFHQGLNQKELVDQYEQELQKLGGKVIRIPSNQQVPQALTEWLAESKINKIIAWKEESELGKLFRQTISTLPQYETSYWTADGDRDQLIQAAEQADVGFTFAEQGLSETGTVMLYNGGDRGRLVSLLPTICAVFLYASTVVPRITQVLDQMKDRVEEHACINFITGPSRSADIEMDLSIGVHGPGQIVVFLIEDHLHQ